MFCYLVAVIALQTFAAIVVRVMGRTEAAAATMLMVHMLDGVGVRRRRRVDLFNGRRGRVARFARAEHRGRGRRWRAFQEGDRRGRRLEAGDFRNAFFKFVSVADLLLKFNDLSC